MDFTRENLKKRNFQTKHIWFYLTLNLNHLCCDYFCGGGVTLRDLMSGLFKPTTLANVANC